MDQFKISMLTSENAFFFLGENYLKKSALTMKKKTEVGEIIL